MAVGVILTRRKDALLNVFTTDEHEVPIDLVSVDDINQAPRPGAARWWVTERWYRSLTRSNFEMPGSGGLAVVMRPASAALTRPARGSSFLLIVKVSMGG